MFCILFTRASSIDLSKARIWSNSAFILAVGVGSSGPEEVREAVSGPLVIRMLFPETDLNSPEWASELYRRVIFGNLGNAVKCYLGWAAWIRIVVKPMARALMNCFPGPRHDKGCTIGSIRQAGAEAG
jgi:hypothetical protein